VGGDFANQDRTVAHAIADGKRAAVGMHHHLMGLELPDDRLQLTHDGPVVVSPVLTGFGLSYNLPKAVHSTDVNQAYFRKMERTRQPALGAALRISSFKEIEGDVSEASLKWEASRCFHCGVCDDCGNCHVFCPDSAVKRDLADGALSFDLEHCKGCGICAEECPRAAIEMSA
jgi:Pyruvate/2-oxoacid:ferredoxin oxidoreductase delta subunit